MIVLGDEPCKRTDGISKILFFSFLLLIGLIISTTAFANDILRLQIRGESSGFIDILLNEELAPNHVKRIKLLTKEKLYNGVSFHRVIPKFMAQTGDIKYGNISSFESNLVGMGGSDYPMLEEEFSQISFVEGTVGMARSQDPNSANSQFFIMFEPAPHLNGNYTVVGEVVAGMEVVKAIKKGNRANNGTVSSPDYILKAEIVEQK
jgi:peptidyl-prolyl cis-trans isomerase A (cyclophilin A)